MKSVCSRPGFGLFAATSFVCLLACHLARAESATWNLNPTSGDWNTAANWTPTTVPNGPEDVATFDVSNLSLVFLSASAEVAGLVFDAGAPGYSITPQHGSILTISGSGVTNNSGQLQSFTTSVDNRGNFSQILFTNSAAAGTGTSYLNQGGGFQGAETDFFDTATADNAGITNQDGSVFGGLTNFFGFSSAGNSVITNLDSKISLGMAGHTNFYENSKAAQSSITNNGGGGSFLFPGTVFFHDMSSAGESRIVSDGADALFGSGAFATFDDRASAGQATIVANGGAESGATTEFYGHSSAGNATLIANGSAAQSGGVITFQESSSGARSRIKLIGNGSLDITLHPSGLTIGSLEGDGNVHLGDNRLRVGANARSTTFDGVIDGAGSLNKVGHGKLILTGANSYLGGTIIEDGDLLLANTNSSAAGSGPMQINKGTLGGIGRIASTVTVGNGSDAGAILSPGLDGSHPGAFSIKDALTFASLSIYKVTLDSATSSADEVIANGLTISSGAVVSLEDIGNGTLAPGAVFRVLRNTSSNAIAGTFSNLPDGSTLTIGNNRFQVSYEGGDGNDLTLTVVP